MVNNTLNFSTILASSVHDIKNILGSVLESIDWLQSNSSFEENQQQEVNKMSQLLAHANSELMQLLCLYKFENDQYQLNKRMLEVEDFLELQSAFLIPLLNAKDIELIVEVEDELMWSFDEMLVSTALRNAIMNSIKFAKSKIIVHASEDHGMLKFMVEDDGAGYPTSMLGKLAEHLSGVDFSTGSTGLGLFFVESVAKLHDTDKQQSNIELANSLGELGGACFIFSLPK